MVILLRIMEKEMKARLESTKARYEEFEKILIDNDVLSDMNVFKALSKEKASIEDIVAKYDEYLRNESDKNDAFIMMDEADEEISSFAKATFQELSKNEEKIIDDLKILLIPKDPNDGKNIIVEIRGAVGGDEGNIFAGDLFRMYFRYAEKQGWKTQILDAFECGAGGYSFISFMIKGDNVYSKLKFESGAHRVQRVPKTEASGRIHTSTATVLVMPEAEEIEIEIRSEDLHVDTYRSQGAGGQNVNRTDSAVRITHVPTGIVVSCQTEKSQLQNREICMKMLRAKMFAAKEAEQAEKIGNERKFKVGTGERSEKIRTYNYPQNRVTDHRIGFTLQKLDRIIEGDIDEILDALNDFDVRSRMNAGNETN